MLPSGDALWLAALVHWAQADAPPVSQTVFAVCAGLVAVGSLVGWGYTIGKSKAPVVIDASEWTKWRGAHTERVDKLEDEVERLRNWKHNVEQMGLAQYFAVKYNIPQEPPHHG